MSTSGIRICEVESAKTFLMTDEEDEFEYDSVYSPPIQTINGHEGAVYGLSFHPKTKLLYSVGQDCCLRAWDISNLDDIGCKCIYRYGL
jgi:WD40 repeat protein